MKSFSELNIRFFGPAVSPCAASKSPGNRPWSQLVDPLTRPSGNGTHLGGYLGPRPARSRLSPNEESGAAASVVDESGHLTCLRLTHGGPAAAQCSRSGARGPDGSRAARRRSSALRASAPYVRLAGVKTYGPRHNSPGVLERTGQSLYHRAGGEGRAGGETFGARSVRVRGRARGR